MGAGRQHNHYFEDVFVLADGDRGTLRLIVKSAVYKYAYLRTYLLTDWLTYLLITASLMTSSSVGC